MCGINLCYGEENAKKMNAAIGHRGIRSRVQNLFGDLYLGHVRLPIQGLNKSNDHPVAYKNYIGAFVGEIYNYKELCEGIYSSDLPVLLEEFSKYGERAFHAFDGSWAAIIYNDDAYEVEVFSDYLSKKPLYIRTDTFGISSEIKALLELGKVSFDKTYFAAVAKWGYCPEGLTPFNEIKKLPYGSRLVYSANDAYLKMARQTEFLNPHPGRFLTRFTQSVKNRTVADVPISLLMSGGLDSTILYYVLKEISADPLTIFHVENDEDHYLNFIDFRPQDKIIKVSIKDSEYVLNDVLWANDGPVDLGSMIPQYLLSREISKNNITVCLSGDGADELFGGYQRAREYDSQYSDIYHELIYYHLPRLDKMMFAHKVELRCPFLSKDIIEFAMSLPYEQRTQKEFLKQQFQSIIPKEIIDRPKKALRYKHSQEWRLSLIRAYQQLIEEKELLK